MKPDPMEAAWLAFTDGEYYHRVLGMLENAGFAEKVAEAILQNTYEYGFLHGLEDES